MFHIIRRDVQCERIISHVLRLNVDYKRSILHILRIDLNCKIQSAVIILRHKVSTRQFSYLSQQIHRYGDRKSNHKKHLSESEKKCPCGCFYVNYSNNQQHKLTSIHRTYIVKLINDENFISLMWKH